MAKVKTLPVITDISISVYAVIVAGSLVDLSVIDFSCVNIACYNLKSNKLKKVSAQFEPLYEDFYSLHNIVIKDAKKITHELKYLHVLLPIDFSKAVNKATYIRCIDLIKLLFPSDLQYHTIAEFSLTNGNQTEWTHSMSYNFYTSGDSHYDNYLAYPVSKQLSEINKFIPLFFSRISSLNYVQIAMDAYNTSFLPMPIHMSFVSLCMALETVVDGKSELMYRIRRTAALLCADNSYHGNIIFENVKLIYELRSSIVHGEEIKFPLVYLYYPYLRSLVSLIITRLIHLNIPTSKALQEKLVFMDFAQMKEDAPVERQLINLFTYTDTMKELKKQAVKRPK